ncbi:hypothetical protein BLOT_001841 [Blomia tropicalis]|nr:hypothetical protein BLOT_001841 [Blomia tropicalis]
MPLMPSTGHGGAPFVLLFCRPTPVRVYHQRRRRRRSRIVSPVTTCQSHIMLPQESYIRLGTLSPEQFPFNDFYCDELQGSNILPCLSKQQRSGWPGVLYTYYIYDDDSHNHE